MMRSPCLFAASLQKIIVSFKVTDYKLCSIALKSLHIDILGYKHVIEEAIFYHPGGRPGC